MKYLKDDEYTQNLRTRQKQIDSLLIKVADNIIEQEKKNEVVRVEKSLPKLDILKLTKLRTLVNLNNEIKPSPVFKEIIQKAKYMVSSWGGSMYFIYLPPYSRYSLKKESPYRDFVIKNVQELNIPFIDIHEEVFALHSDPVSLFPFRLSGHYNADGYRLIAEAIYKRLINDGLQFKNFSRDKF